ncbi:30S ribosomal protein S8e [Candidatus Bathyarchaeota archaeon]|nr:30S ribosomal protein S8e [Candidatus Bathyarchaeota archaeon]
MVWHDDLTKRKRTGGRKKAYRKRRKYEAGRFPVETQLGEPERKLERTKGGGLKVKLVSDQWVNLSDPKTGKTERVRILSVVKNPANVDWDRRGIITRGTIVRTERGLAKIISRPGQNGVLNAIPIEE